jgi:hypothetical protein
MLLLRLDSCELKTRIEHGGTVNWFLAINGTNGLLWHSATGHCGLRRRAGRKWPTIGRNLMTLEKRLSASASRQVFGTRTSRGQRVNGSVKHPWPGRPNDLARTANDVAEKANKLARTNNTIAIVALVGAMIAIAISIISLVLKSHLGLGLDQL